MKLGNADNDSLSNLRKQYFESMPEFQELYIELMVPDSNAYTITIDNRLAGYLIVSTQMVLIEFYLNNDYVSVAHDVLRDAVTSLAVTNIYCKTFDFLLLGSCLRNGFHYQVAGLLFRHYNHPLVEKISSLVMMQSGVESIPLLTSQDCSIHELFETAQQLEQFIVNEQVFEFYSENKLVGCGMIIKTHSNFCFCDLGVWVHPSKRGKGIAANILLLLREHALKQGFLPSCGCAIDNLASQKAIVKSGYLSKYQLLDFEVNNLKK